jgi:hypothetical protein
MAARPNLYGVTSESPMPHGVVMKVELHKEFRGAARSFKCSSRGWLALFANVSKSSRLGELTGGLSCLLQFLLQNHH